MTAITVRIPDDLYAELKEIAALGFEHNESEAVRECVRRGLGKVKSSFIGNTKPQAKKFRKTLVRTT